jgi:NADH-quinone oxidoreductase subunit H
VILVKAVLVFVFLVVMTLFAIWAERRVVARMQSRPGPNRVGPFGLLQSLMDGVKLALKEDLIPKAADKVVFIIAPIISATCAFVAFAVIPFGPSAHIPWTDIDTPLQLTDLPVAVVYILAVAAVGVYGIVLAGWSSGSTYPLLGGLRSSAQVISYEIAMSLALVSVFIFSGSLSTSAIVDAQAHGAQVHIPGTDFTFVWGSWYAFTLLFPAFVVYVIAMVGETNRAPFDLPEAEGELVGGFHTEYTSLKFALFFLAEYINMVTVSALATTLFLGGWRVPFGIDLIWHGANEGWWPLLWFVGKLLAFLFFFIWLRGTLPRLRYDQFMTFGWKRLIPFALVWAMLVATVREMQRMSLTPTQRGYLIVGIVVVFAVGYGLVELALNRREKEAEAKAAERVPATELDPFAGGYPVPPMPGQTLLRTSGSAAPGGGA